MSMDAGGLAQLNYSFHPHQGNPTSFASRGKGSHLRNISVPVPSNNLSAPGDSHTVTTPRTARSALLAGLRTAPKTPNPTPTPAPPAESILDSRYNSPGSSRYAAQNAARSGQSPNRYQGYQNNPYSANSHQQQQQLPTPPPSSSPALGLNGEVFELSDETDAEMYQQLLTTNILLAQKHAQLQAQLANLAANSMAAQQAQMLQQQFQQQFQQLQLQSSGSGNFSTPPMSPGGIGSYLQSTNNANMGGNGYYPVYNTMQSQYGYYLQQPQISADYLQQYQSQQQQQQSPPASAQPENSPSAYQSQRQSSTTNASTGRSGRSQSPPKLTLNQPAISSNGFKRGHRKASSLSTCVNVSNLDIAEPPKTSLPKPSQMPTTPMTATFAPGHASGSHPIRQPRGPPAMEELVAKPINKDGGSKNFATRQRRRAIFKLVAAGVERRTARSASSSIGGTMTPVSENEGFTFEDGESVSSSLSGRASRASIRGGDSPQDYSASSVSGDESVGGKQNEGNESGGLKAPRLVFSSAAKRNSALF